MRWVMRFQGANELSVDGVVGDATFRVLEPLVDAYGRWLLARFAEQFGRETRSRIVAAARLAYDNRDAIHYTQSARRMQGVREKIRPPRYPTWEDCSSFVTWCYWAAGAPDPNGNGYDGVHGNTGDQSRSGSEVRDPRRGDLVFYGPGHADINHVTLYVGNGRVISHGREEGPEVYPIDYRRPGGPRQQIRSYVT